MQQDTASTPSHSANSKLWPLVLGSLGVVFGDIGTSPLYAFREAVHAVGGHGADRMAVLGVLSLILWALILIVTLKYVVVLLYADNNGEGGTLSLMALAQRALGKRSRTIFLLGIAGAALFYGDAVITPAISVMSAVEGLKLVHPSFEMFVMPLTLFVLLLLFMFQSKGTSHVAMFFGPVMAFWFVTLGALGIRHIIGHPEIFSAFNPVYGMQLLVENPKISLVILGAIFLSVTGAEALYADLGHFGRNPIQSAWMWFILPSLALNYLGQGALVLQDPTALDSPFFRLAPPNFLLFLVVLAGAATVIASQAVITGAYSLTRSAIQLGLLPRFEIRHTSEHQHGQIYLPRVNLWLLIGVVLLVVMFQSSSRLASAYGLAVTCSMAVDTLMAFVVVWKLWHVRPVISFLLIAPIFAIDVTFISANLVKVHEGGWLPLMLGGFLLLIMLTWVEGSKYLAMKQRRMEVPMDQLPLHIHEKAPARVPGTAIFLTSDASTAPMALLHNLKHNKVLHEQNLILSIVNTDAPRVPEEERITITPMFDSFTAVTMRYGFMETPNVLKGLSQCRRMGWKFDVMQTTFFLARRTLKASASEGLPLWQDYIFIAMAKNADTATDFFRLPVDHVMEVGTQVKV